MVAGAAAVLALVVVIIVVACNGPSPASKHDAGAQPAAAGGSSGSVSPSASPSRSPGHTGRHRSTGPGTGKTIATFSGTGSAKTKRFLILGTGDWTLGWSYRCSSPGSFAVTEDGGTDINGVQVSKHGSGEHGWTKVFGDTGHHYLTVTSACSWRLTVTGKS